MCRAAAQLTATALALVAAPAAEAHVTWVTPGPRAGTLAEDTQAPCGHGQQATPGTSPAAYQAGAEIGVFFREDHGHTFNFTTKRAYFTIGFSPGGDAGFTELKRIDVASGALPRIYGNVVVGGPGYVALKLPTAPTEQGILQLTYHTTDGTPDMYSCADIRIKAPAAPPPPPLDVKIQPGSVDDVFELKLATINTGTSPLSGLTSLTPGGLHLATDAYPADKRADVGVLFGPAPDIAGSLIPGERREHLFLLEARSPGFAVASGQARATGAAGATYEDTGLAEIDVSRRVPTLLDLWAQASGGLAQIYDGMRRDGLAASARMRAAFYRSRPNWKLGFRKATPNAAERALADLVGADPSTFAAGPDNLGDLFELYRRYEIGRTKALGGVLQRAGTTGFNVALRTPFEFYTDANARASAGPELTRAALEFGAERDAYLGEAWSFWTDKNKILDARSGIPNLVTSTLKEIRPAATRAYNAGLQGARKAGQTMIRDPGLAFEQLGGVEGRVQGEVGLAILEDVVGGKVFKALGLVNKARKASGVVEVASELEELAPGAKSLDPVEQLMGRESAELISEEVVGPVQRKFASAGLKIELQVRPTNPWSRAVKNGVGKVVLIPTKNLEVTDVLLGADARALGQAAHYRPRLPRFTEVLPGPVKRALKARYAQKLEEYTAYRAAKAGLTRGSKMERMTRALKPGGATLTETFGTKTTKFKMELAEQHYGETVALRYKELVVDGDVLVRRGHAGAPVTSDFDIHAAIVSGAGQLPAAIRGQAELLLYDGMRKLAVNKGIPFGFHGFTFNGFDIGATTYRKLFGYILEHLSAENARRVAAYFAPKFGTTPEKLLGDLTHGEFVVKITADGVTTGPGVNPLGP